MCTLMTTEKQGYVVIVRTLNPQKSARQTACHTRVEMSWSWLKIACAVFLLPVVQPFPVTPTSATGRLVPVFSDLSISEGDYLLTTVLQGIDACGGRFVWRSRHEFLNATAHAGPTYPGSR